jgi:hypothetical protein
MALGARGNRLVLFAERHLEAAGGVAACRHPALLIALVEKHDLGPRHRRAACIDHTTSST